MLLLLLLAREEELEEEDELEPSLERELLELEEDLVPFFRPGTRIFLSFNRTVFPSGASSSSLKVITFMIFSAAFGPTCTSISSLSIAAPEAAKIETNRWNCYI